MIESEMPKKLTRVNTARKRLKEIKRSVPDPKRPGSTTRRSFYGHTLAEAEQSYREFINPPLNLDQTDDLPEGSFVWYLVNAHAPLKAHSRANTRNTNKTVARHVLEEIGHLQVKDITAVVLAEMLSRLDHKLTHRNKAAKPKMKSGNLVQPVEIWEKLAPSTVNKCRRLALEVCEIAAEMDQAIRPINSKRVPRREEPEPEVDVYSPVEMRRLLVAAAGHPLRAGILLYGFLGVRLREGCGFSYTDLKPDGTLQLRYQVDIETGALTANLKSKYAKRDFPLPDGLLEELRALCFPRSRLILNSEGNPYRADSIDRDLAVIMRRAGLRILTAHGFRHSFSSWLDENGCPRSVRIRLLGQTPKGVHDRYNHPTKMKEWLGRFWEASFEEEDSPRVVTYIKGKPGPAVPLAGERNGRSRLTADEVRTIRAELATRTVAEISRTYGVHRRTIEKIRDGEIWKSA